MNGVELVVSYLTPTVLFCTLNLMIATIFILHSQRKQPKLTEEPNPPQLVRFPSLFERVKSFNISRYRSDPQPDPTHSEEPAHEHDSASEEVISHVARSNSDTAVKKSKPKAKVLRKSASEKLVPTVEEEVVEQPRPATVREKTTASNSEDEAVDERADDFINRFRQQLKLQRLDSILRYKEMLNRGAGR